MRKDSIKARNCLNGDLELEGGKGSCKVNFSKNWGGLPDHECSSKKAAID